MITINVTEKHIINGLRSDGGKCPIALAFIDTIPGISDIEVDSSSIEYTKDKDRWQFFTDREELELFVESFDNHLPVHPIILTGEPKLKEYFGE